MHKFEFRVITMWGSGSRTPFVLLTVVAARTVDIAA